MTTRITGNFSPEPIYYVYLHKRNDTNCVFYVGKGKNKRAWSKGSRNKHWKHITEKHGYSIEIIKSNLTESQAFEEEIITINTYGISNLVNMTIGGNTSTGYVHTEATRQKQSEIAHARKLSNPEWYERCVKRITELSEKQRSDPLFYKQLGEYNSKWYGTLTPEQKIEYTAKKVKWQEDEEKVALARKKKSETCKSKKYLENQRLRAIQQWAKLTPAQRETENLKRAEYARKAAQYKTGVISTSTTYLVNRQVLIPSITKCIEKYGSGFTATIREMHDTGRNLTIFKGFVFEVYNKEVHTSSYTKNTEDLLPLESKRWNPKSAVKSSDGRVFLSISEAARSFGDKRTDSTADWISRCIKSNRDAMGFYWSRPTNEECEQRILTLLEEQK